MPADILVKVVSESDVDYCTYKRMGVGEEAITQALRFSDLIRRMPVGEASPQEIVEYSKMIVEYGELPATCGKGRYRVGVIMGLETLVENASNQGYRRTDDWMKDLFGDNSPKEDLFKELLKAYMEAYHANRIK